MPFTRILDYNSNWKYKDDNVDYYTPAFYTAAYDSSSWPSGNGVHGNGTLDSLPGGYSIQTTLVNPTSSDTRTYYLTTDIVIVRRHALYSINLSGIRDDGIVLWCQGSEIWRVNVTGALSHGRNADAAGGEGVPSTTTLRGSQLDPFIEGTNRIAMMGFDFGAASTDSGFAIRMDLNFHSPKTLTGAGS